MPCACFSTTATAPGFIPGTGCIIWEPTRTVSGNSTWNGWPRRAWSASQNRWNKYVMPSPGKQERTTHFGFREVPESAKDHLVAGVFHSVASKYDLMND